MDDFYGIQEVMVELSYETYNCDYSELEAEQKVYILRQVQQYLQELYIDQDCLVSQE